MCTACRVQTTSEDKRKYIQAICGLAFTATASCESFRSYIAQLMQTDKTHRTHCRRACFECGLVISARTRPYARMPNLNTSLHCQKSCCYVGSPIYLQFPDSGQTCMQGRYKHCLQTFRKHKCHVTCCVESSYLKHVVIQGQVSS